MKRKIMSVLLSLLLCFLVVGCAPTASEDPPTQLPNGYVRGKVLTDNGSMTTAGIIVENENGDRYRYLTNYLSGYDLSLAPGKYKLYFTRGAEFSIVEKAVEVESLKVTFMTDIRLVRMFDTYEKGFIGGDLHQHTYYSDGRDSVDKVLLSNISTGLYFGFLSDHNSARGLSEWTQGNRHTADIDNQSNQRLFSAFEAVEVTTEFGHYQSLGVGLTFDQYEVILREAERALPKAQREELMKQRIQYIGETITREGGLAQINHPYSTGTMGFTYWDVADYFDTIEIWNGVYVPGDGRYEPDIADRQSANYRAKMKWFELLNEVKNGGKFHAATGGTDNHEVASSYTGKGDIIIADMGTYTTAYEKDGKYSGIPTTYARIDSEVTLAKTLDALRRGSSFITNAPMVIAKVGQASYGDTVMPVDGKISLDLEIFNRDGFEKIKIIKNGVEALSFDAEGSLFEGTKQIDVVAGDWILLEVLGTGTQYAITNPIFIG